MAVRQILIKEMQTNSLKNVTTHISCSAFSAPVEYKLQPIVYSILIPET